MECFRDVLECFWDANGLLMECVLECDVMFFGIIAGIRLDGNARGGQKVGAVLESPSDDVGAARDLQHQIPTGN